MLKDLITHGLAIGAGYGLHAWFTHRGVKAALSDVNTALGQVKDAVKASTKTA
jgi:hypothetical protein